ncbi:oncostatin-M [Sorex fumeus]|uniref:oncostatin-M n=1 Tax=Sorex fumeus TaxID=62283 RepID=UPI0024AD4002|nr:oncostatin-M [Sorex fumeus]
MEPRTHEAPPARVGAGRRRAAGPAPRNLPAGGTCSDRRPGEGRQDPSGGLALGLLLLSRPAAGSCPSYQDLLRQLQIQAVLLQDHSRLLDPYMHFQGLHKSILRDHCWEQPGAFPSEDDLRALSRPAFLRTVQDRLHRITSFLKTFPKDLPETQPMTTALRYIQGFQNNVHCMAQLLPDASPARPPQEGPGALPTPSSNSLQRKLDGCRLLRGHHRFIHSVGRVLGEWGAHPSRSRRHSAPLDLWKQAWRMKASRRGKKLVSRAR